MVEDEHAEVSLGVGETRVLRIVKAHGVSLLTLAFISSRTISN